MTEQALALNVGELGIQKYDDSMFDKVAANKYLARIQFMSSASEPCKDGSFPVNHYALYKSKTPIDLTAEVTVLVVSWRPKALRMGDSVLAYYDVENEEFKKIVEESANQDSGCMYGPEFLCYIPSLKEFATFFMGSKSARNESPNMKALIGKGAILRSQKLQNKKYTWQSPQVVGCSTPFELPAIEEIKKIAEQFSNPPTNEVETVEEGASDRAR